MISREIYTLGEIFTVGLRPDFWFLNKKKTLINEKTDISVTYIENQTN